MRWAPMGIFVILAIAALKVGSALALPIVVALLLSLLLSSPVAWLKRKRIPEPVGAGILVFGSVLLFLASLWFLVDPAVEWMAKAPSNLAKAEQRLRTISKPLHSIQQTAAKVDDATTATPTNDAQIVQLAQPGVMQRISGGSTNFAANAIGVIFLSYFLLAAAPRFRRKLATVLPGRAERSQVEEVMREIELHMSRYLWLSTVINLIVGLLTWGLLAILGFPNAALWGAVAGILNYIPYIGALATLAVIAFAGVVSFTDLNPVLLGVGGFFVINMFESNLITPAFLGSKLPLNAAALFLGLMFFGWMWGVTGAVLAVPLTVMVQVVCARIPAVQSFAVFLDS
ncbi:MAG: AI-2E family transporter [Gemmatimonadales bacterium]